MVPLGPGAPSAVAIKYPAGLFESVRGEVGDVVLIFDTSVTGLALKCRMDKTTGLLGIEPCIPILGHVFRQ